MNETPTVPITVTSDENDDVASNDRPREQTNRTATHKTSSIGGTITEQHPANPHNNGWMWESKAKTGTQVSTAGHVDAVDKNSSGETQATEKHVHPGTKDERYDAPEDGKPWRKDPS